MILGLSAEVRMSERFAVVDAIAEDFQSRGGQPALAYGVVADGRLVHARGLGERWVGGPAPDQQTVFRIASMTKSFTAAGILLLRDEGALRLDDPAEAYVPELAGLCPIAGSIPVTIRQLLTMTAGLPTDDPWGDRLQGQPLAEFAEFLAGGVSLAWAPGTRFEYSNLGYAILGRVITAASGEDYAEFVRTRLFQPLGMTATGLAADEFHPDQLARGYQGEASAWQEVAMAPYGAFAPMGGILSCVSDLALWVSGFQEAFVPGDEQTGGRHPLRITSRWEMQSAQTAIPPAAFIRAPGGLSGGEPPNYGFGLFIEEDPLHGVVVQHSGGYPGFGSNMRWHRATGLGVIALANRTYAAPWVLAEQMLNALLREPGLPADTRRAETRPADTQRADTRRAGRVSAHGPAMSHPAAWPQTLAARDEVMSLLTTWDDASADGLFADNVALDEPFADRRAAIETIRERIGKFAVDERRPAEFDSPAHCRWWLRGEKGAVAAEITLTPEREPRVQSLTLAIPPAADSALAGVVAALTSIINRGDPGGDPSALAALPAAGSLDKNLLARQLRMAGAWSGRVVAAASRAGDGVRSTTVQLDGEHAGLTLSVVVDSGGALHQADVSLEP
jgi:CubicO group peptidase (beta-lactamase class C family)